jgi:hypothetical protein
VPIECRGARFLAVCLAEVGEYERSLVEAKRSVEQTRAASLDLILAVAGMQRARDEQAFFWSRRSSCAITAEVPQSRHRTSGGCPAIQQGASVSSMNRTALPPWVVDNRTAVAREAAPYRGLTPEQRSRALAAACRAAARQLAARPDRQRLLEYRDPLPETSVAALRRLRAAARRTA